MIIDYQTEIDDVTMLQHLSDTSDTLGKFELAPSTHKLLQIVEADNANKLLFNSSRPYRLQHNRIKQLTGSNDSNMPSVLVDD